MKSNKTTTTFDGKKAAGDKVLELHNENLTGLG